MTIPYICYYMKMQRISFSLSGRAAEDTIIEDIKRATSSILIEMFIISVDYAGLRLLDTLREKAKQGVKVRLIADAVGSFALWRSKDIQKELRDAGIEYSFFNHLVPWYPKNLRMWYFRTHRRAVTIDGIICHVGSVCFDDDMQDWRETMMRIESDKVASDMARQFDRMWKLSEHGIFGKKEKQTDYLSNAPLPGRRQLYRKLIELIRGAKTEILITTPYFIPDHRLHRAIHFALKKGVRVVVLIPRPSDHPYVDWAGDYDKTIYMRMGVEFYFYQGMIHSKTAVLDGEIALIGSLNMDNISLRYNFENALLVRDADAANQLREHFTEDLKNSRRMTLEEWRERPFVDKFLMVCMWPFRKLL